MLVQLAKLHMILFFFSKEAKYIKIASYYKSIAGPYVNIKYLNN